MSDVTWSGGAGDWDASNWSSGSPPGAVDTAIINSGTVTVSIIDDVSAASLMIAGGFLDIAGELSLGTASLGDDTYAIANSGGTISIDGGGLIVGQYITSASGTVTVSDDGTYQWGGSGSTQTIQFSGSSGGSFQFLTDFGGTISGFNSADTISYSTSNTITGYTIGDDVVTFTDSAGSHQIQFAGNYNATNLMVSGNTITTTVVACFCAGTLIATPDGDRLVELLAPGDRVLTAADVARRIRWIGRRSYAGRFLAANPALHPVRIAAGALGENLPRRDLRLSPAHAMLLDGVLVPVGALVNGVSIRPESGLPRVSYFHIELDTHDILLAEGAAAESFLDTDNRGMFENALTAPPRPATAPCARRCETGAEVEALRNRIDAGRVQEVWLTCAGWHDIAIACGVSALRLRSSPAVAAGDARRLGVAIAAIEIDGAALKLRAAALASGWHAAEHGWRWTDGAGLILIPAGSVTARVDVVAVARRVAA